MIVFGLWFGMYGALAAYCGGLLSVILLFRVPFPVNLVSSLADFWQVLIPLLAFRLLRADITLSSTKDIGIFLIFGWLLNNLAGALWGTGVLAFAGISSWNEFPNQWAGWFTGNLIATIIIAPILLRFLTPYVEKRGLIIKGYWK
jgi:integral membrane sensor domain MASE1